MVRMTPMKFFFAVIAMSCVTAASNTYPGCFNAMISDELGILVYTSTSNSKAMCKDTCAYQNYTLAGLKDVECHCGNSICTLTQIDDSSCINFCPGNMQQKCGGMSAYSIYQTALNGGAAPSSTQATYNYTGCYIDQESRDLPFNVYVSSFNTINFCSWMCAWFNYTYAGAQAGAECYCGNSFGQHGPTASSFDCNIPCPIGTGICGGIWRNSIYNILVSVNGAWSAWSPWKACDASCGGGIQRRSRNCTNPAPAYGGVDCPAADATQQQPCNTNLCPIVNSTPVSLSPLDVSVSVNAMKLLDGNVSSCVSGTNSAMLRYRQSPTRLNQAFNATLSGHNLRCGSVASLGNYLFTVSRDWMGSSGAAYGDERGCKLANETSMSCRFECNCQNVSCSILTLWYIGCGIPDGTVCEVLI